MADYDWQRFDLHYYYQASLEEVWRAWATADGLCSFFVGTCQSFDQADQPQAGDAEFVAGGRYEWRWQHDFSGSGTFNTVEHQRFVSFTFGQTMQVSVTLEPSPNGVHVWLQQWDIPDSEEGRVWGHLNCRSCWIFFMTNLTSVLGGAGDLRHVNPAVVSSMEVGFEPPPA